MADARVEAMYHRFSRRIISSYVAPWELEPIGAEVGDYEQWRETVSGRAEVHVSGGDGALEAGKARTAGESDVRAGPFCHRGSLLSAHGPSRLQQVPEGAAGCIAKFALRVDPPMELVEHLVRRGDAAGLFAGRGDARLARRPSRDRVAARRRGRHLLRRAASRGRPPR